MKLLPAIDLLDNRCVRLTQGDFERVTVYKDAPEEIAAMFESMGADMLHLVDLDGARTGNSINRISIEKIRNRVRIPIEVGGGIRTLEQAEAWLSLGVDRIILGTVAIESLTLLETLVKTYKDRIVVSIDADQGIVKTRGWKISTGILACDLMKTLEDVGVKTVIYTDIQKDGMLEGPNFPIYESLVQKTTIKIIASGGIASIDDLVKLKKIGLEGAIVGKAYYEGKIDLKEAIRCLQDASSPALT